MELVEAARRNDLNEVNRLLLNPRININQTDENGNTALIYAANDGNVDIGQRLIESGADVNKANDNGETPLISAVMYNRNDFVVLMLEQPSINLDAATIQIRGGATALLMAIDYIIHERVPLDILEMLLNSGADPNIPYASGNTALIVAANAGRVDIITLLVDNGADINQKNEAGRTVLMISSAIAAAYSVAALLKVPGIDIDATDNSGKTALMSAAQRRLDSAEVVVGLLAAGADPLIASKQGITAQQYTHDGATNRFLDQAEKLWRDLQIKANQNLQKKFMISRRLRGNQTLPQRELGDYIIRRSEYDNLCLNLQNNMNKPGVIALAKSLQIETSNKSKIILCKEIATKLII